MGIYEELEWRGLIKDISSPELKEKLNKKQLEEVGTERTQGKPINILKSKII